MDPISLSDESKRLGKIFSEFYKQKELFDENRGPQRTPKLLNFLDEFAVSLARDIRGHAIKKGLAEDTGSKFHFTGTLLYNAAYLVTGVTFAIATTPFTSRELGCVTTSDRSTKDARSD
jgi:hypothetical protein